MASVGHGLALISMEANGGLGSKTADGLRKNLGLSAGGGCRNPVLCAPGHRGVEP